MLNNSIKQIFQKKILIKYRSIIIAIILGLSFPLNAQKILEKESSETTITINATNELKPVTIKFGTGVGSLHRGPGWAPVNLNNPDLVTLFNEVKPSFINLQYTNAPSSVDNIKGLPFYRESTGEFSQRLSYIKTIEKMGADSNSTGVEGELYSLFTSNDTLPNPPVLINGVSYYTYKQLCTRPPNHNYDDILQFFERLEEPPEIFIRLPIFFFTIIDDPYPHSGNERVEVSIDLDPQTGADMVHYFNDPPTTELGALRAANGHTEPYNIKHFMLGNELWWPHIDFDLSLDRIIKQTKAFSEAMKEADSTITIVFNPVNDSFPNSFLHTTDPVYGEYIKKLSNFNAKIIPATKNYVDAVEFFQYGLGVGDGTVLPYLNNENWKSSMALSFIYDKYNNAGMHRDLADRYSTNTPMIMGEFSGPSARLGGAIYDADYTIYLLKNNYDVFIANWNAGLIENNYYGLINQDISNNRPPIKRPNYYVLKMFTTYLGDTIVESNITDSPMFDAQSFNTGKYLTYPAVQNVPTLNCIATKKDDRLYLMVINRDLENSILSQIVLNNFFPADVAKVYTLNGPSIDATNEIISENVKIIESSIEDVSDSFSYLFEKHSVTVIVFNSSTTRANSITDQIPSRFELMQNYPNPFNPSTNIRYGIPHSSQVNLSIYDIMGRKVITLINKQQSTGWYDVTWSGENENDIPVSSGIYFIHLKAGTFVGSKKTLLIK